MASAAYQAWTAGVRAQGGRVVVASDAVNQNTGRPNPPRVLSGAYDVAIWGPKVNAREWPLPDEYSANGRTAYYHAPAALVAEARTFGTANAAEAARAGQQLLSQWHLSGLLDGLASGLKGLALLAVVAVGLWAVVRHPGRD